MTAQNVPRTCEHVTQQKDFADVIEIIDLNIRKLSWNIWVGLNYLGS